MTEAARWLNDTFSEFDYAILEFCHVLEESAGGFFTPFMNFVSALGSGGILFVSISLILLLFRSTRKTGLCMLLAVGVGALFTNVGLKQLISRPRPFADAASEYHAWWLNVGATPHAETSFPSGHTTATMAAMTAVFLTTDKKRSWCGFFFVVLMGFSRNYLMMHYPSDIIGGVLVGGTAAAAAYGILHMLHRISARRPDSRLSVVCREWDAAEFIERLLREKKDKHS